MYNEDELLLIKNEDINVFLGYIKNDKDDLTSFNNFIKDNFTEDIIEKIEKFCQDNEKEFGQKRKDTLKLDSEKHKIRRLESDCCRK